MAALTVRTEVIAGRASAPVEHRMAAAAWTAPHTRPASFRDLADRAVGFADGRRHDGGAGGGRETHSQCGAQEDRLHHVAAFSLCRSQAELTPGPESAGVRSYQPTRQLQSGRRCKGRLGQTGPTGPRAINARSEYARHSAASRRLERGPRPAGD